MWSVRVLLYTDESDVGCYLCCSKDSQQGIKGGESLNTESQKLIKPYPRIYSSVM